MKRIILILYSIPLALFADFSEKEANELAQKAATLRQELKLDKPPLTEEEKKIIAIRKELNIPHNDSLREIEKPKIDTQTQTMKRIILTEDTSTITDAISSTFMTIKKSLSLEESDEGFSLEESFGLKEGEYFGLPSVFGLNEKKEETGFGLSTFTDIKDMGGTFYKGFKYSGESAEFMSGMMYYNAKMYNTMFGIFDDSPFNVFEDEDENSILDVFEKGNDILDIFN
ncbi:MAG: hypothetical protein L3J43_07655 [Sulfurovum sp.]|nr:hypothetical protein [Sulfurovum sp.]